MLNNILTKTASAVLILTLMILPQASYAFWGDRHDFYRYHDHPHFGVHVHFLPHGYFTLRVRGARYYYYDGLYYNYVAGDYVLVTPPVGAVVTSVPADFQPVVVNGITYYVNGGTYYLYTRHHRYRVVMPPVIVQPPVVVVPAPAVPDAITVNVPNNSGGFVAVALKRSGNGYLGPQGEFYADFPKVTQLKVMYGR